MNSCVFIPIKGAETFMKLKKEFGYDIATSLYNVAMDPKFQKDFRKSLQLDEEGMPTYDSLMSNDYIKSKITLESAQASVDKHFSSKTDTVNNYYSMIDKAAEFNTSNALNSKYVAVVDYDDNNDLHVKLIDRNKESLDAFQKQLKVKETNKKIGTALEKAGIKLSHLEDYEVLSGRTGVIDFSQVEKTAKEFDNLIRIANNKEGAEALSEEFAHLIVGIYRNSPLIERAINALSNDEDALRSILGEEYDYTYDFHDGNMEDIAEEALGQLLQSNMLKPTEDVKRYPLLKKIINWIKDKFKSYSSNTITSILKEVESQSNQLMQDILNSNTTIAKEDVVQSRRLKAFNSLSAITEKNIQILKNAIGVEIKRSKIKDKKNKESIASYQRGVVLSLSNYTEDELSTTLNILNYAKQALHDIEYAYNYTADKISKATDIQTKMSILRDIKDLLDSYQPFILDMNAQVSKEIKNDPTCIYAQPMGTENTTVQNVLKQLNSATNELEGIFNAEFYPVMKAFLEPAFGEAYTITQGIGKGTTVDLDYLMRNAFKGISMTDRFLDSASKCSDPLIQTLDGTVKAAKDKANTRTINMKKRIEGLMLEAKKRGLSNFEFMFEKDENGKKTGYYSTGINVQKFFNDREAEFARLDTLYGVGKSKAKTEAINRWHEGHMLNGQPRTSLYGSTRLTGDQKWFMEEYLKLLDECKSCYPTSKVDPFIAIQIRKDGIQRTIDNLKHPSEIINSCKAQFASALLEAEDDVNEFGEKVNKALTKYNGEELLTMPILYNYPLANPEEISTDVFSALMQYSYAAFQYDEINKIIDGIELFEDLLDKRKTLAISGNSSVIENIVGFNQNITKNVLSSSDNIKTRYKDYVRSVIFGQHLADSGTLGKVNINKTVSLLTRLTNTIGIGFNFLSQQANLITGLFVTNIEAAAGQYFKAGQLRKADAQYFKLLRNHLGDLSNRVKTNELDLFDEMIDYKGDLRERLKKSTRSNVLLRIFGPSVQYLGQDAGDNWLYNRTAIAMCMNTEVNVPGKGKMSLWEAKEIKDLDNGTKIMIIPEGTTYTKTGKAVDIKEFGRRILNVNQDLFGVYNEDDVNAASRYALGRLLQQFRRWIKPMINRRFMAEQRNVLLQENQEGYYRTFFRFCSGLLTELRHGKFRMVSSFEELSETDKQNIKRALCEIIQLLVVALLSKLVIKWNDDDKDEEKEISKIRIMLEYCSRRTVHELGQLVPSHLLIQETWKTIKSPIPALSTAQRSINLLTSLMDPTDWVDEIEEGKYEGMSTLQKRMIQSPIPVIAWYQQILRSSGELEESLKSYARPTSY